MPKRKQPTKSQKPVRDRQFSNSSKTVGKVLTATLKRRALKPKASQRRSCTDDSANCQLDAKKEPDR
jgi:hypothetical protein